MKAKKTKLIYRITSLYLKIENKCNGMIAFEEYVFIKDGTGHYITGIDKSINEMEIICHVENEYESSMGWYSIAEYKIKILRKMKKQLLRL